MEIAEAQRLFRQQYLKTMAQLTSRDNREWQSDRRINLEIEAFYKLNNPLDWHEIQWELDGGRTC